jgi:hypothetical protein
MAKSQPAEEKVTQAEGKQVRVRWDESKMTTTYANVCNVSSTREEMTLVFGTRSWHTGQAGLTVEVANRIFLNPLAAKRLSLLLGNVVKEYESRFGELAVDAGSPGVPGPSPE